MVNIKRNENPFTCHWRHFRVKWISRQTNILVSMKSKIFVCPFWCRNWIDCMGFGIATGMSIVSIVDGCLGARLAFSAIKSDGVGYSDVGAFSHFAPCLALVSHPLDMKHNNGQIKSIEIVWHIWNKLIFGMHVRLYSFVTYLTKTIPDFIGV